jgi:hypothetical protein
VQSIDSSKGAGPFMLPCVTSLIRGFDSRDETGGGERPTATRYDMMPALTAGRASRQMPLFSIGSRRVTWSGGVDEERRQSFGNTHFGAEVAMRVIHTPLLVSGLVAGRLQLPVMWFGDAGWHSEMGWSGGLMWLYGQVSSALKAGALQRRS